MTKRAYELLKKEACRERITMDRVLRYATTVMFVLLFAIAAIWAGRSLGRQETAISLQDRMDILTAQIVEERELRLRAEYLLQQNGLDIEVKTTGYCNNSICINDVRWQGKGITATNTVARVGVCASDWNVIPVGTLVYVPDYGLCRVEDRGGKVKGKHLDLFFNSYNEAKEWGVRYQRVKVYL